MAEVLPFPIARRLGFIRRQATWFAQQHPTSGEKTLRRQIEVQREVLERRGVAAEVVERELREMEEAIRLAARQGGDARNA